MNRPGSLPVLAVSTGRKLRESEVALADMVETCSVLIRGRCLTPN
jgi:hypothetical protein